MFILCHVRDLMGPTWRSLRRTALGIRKWAAERPNVCYVIFLFERYDSDAKHENTLNQWFSIFFRLQGFLSRPIIFVNLTSFMGSWNQIWSDCFCCVNVSVQTHLTNTYHTQRITCCLPTDQTRGGYGTCCERVHQNCNIYLHGTICRLRLNLWLSSKSFYFPCFHRL